MTPRKSLQKIVSYALQNEYSALYRKLYGGRVHEGAPDSLAEWEKIPFLEKEMLIDTPFWERTFIERTLVDYIRPSSGTSGKNLLIAPKTHVQKYPAYLDLRSQTGALTFFHPQHQYEKDFAEAGAQMPVIAGDHEHLEESVQLASSLQISYLHIYPFILDEILPLLERYGIREKLRSILLGGERITTDDARRYATLFPNAVIATYYASIESQGLCAFARVDTKPEYILYEPEQDYHFELIDEDGKVLHAPDAEGEVIYTMLRITDNAMPLIRYRSGDIGRRHIKTDGVPRYEILGRRSIDRVKISHGELRTEAIEAALRKTYGTVPDYELHFYRYTDATTKPFIHLVVTKKEQPMNAARLFEEALLVAPDRSYRFLVDNQHHNPLIISTVTELPYPGKKRKRIHVHDGPFLS